MFCVLIRGIVWPSHRVMYVHLFPPILRSIKLRPPIVNRVAYISTATALYIHWVPQLSDFVLLNLDKRSWWGYIKPVVRAIEVSHAACKDYFRRNPRCHSWRLFILKYSSIACGITDINIQRIRRGLSGPMDDRPCSGFCSTSERTTKPMRCRHRTQCRYSNHAVYQTEGLYIRKPSAEPLQRRDSRFSIAPI